MNREQGEKDLIGRFEGSSILITGATGLIGKMLVQLLVQHNRKAKNPVRIYACVRNREKAAALFGAETNALSYIVGDVRDVDLSGVKADYIVHAASETASRAFVNSPVDTIGIALDSVNE